MPEMVADSMTKGSGSEDIIAQPFFSTSTGVIVGVGWVGGFTERKRTEIVRLRRRTPGTNMFGVMYGLVLCPLERGR